MLQETLHTTIQNLPEPLLRKTYFFHDVRINCQTNHPTILTLLDRMLGAFPEPNALRGEASYYILCYEEASHFPVRLPHQRIRTQTVYLLTNTKLKYYMSPDHTIEYHSYMAEPSVNAPVLSAIRTNESIALTQIEMPEQYQAAFLRRYVFLFALGHLMRQYGFEPCHAAAITAPEDSQQGALIIGASESGKTTLSLGCASSGCGLLGDDLVLLRQDSADGLVHAYSITREVSVRPGTIALWKNLGFLQDFPADFREKRYCTIEQIRAGATRLQAPVRLLIFPSLTTEMNSSIIPLSKVQTLHELVDQCMSKVTTRPQAQEGLFLLLSKLAEHSSGYRLAIARGTSDGPDMIRALFHEVRRAQ